MTSHEDWFRELRKTKRPRYLEIGDHKTHSIWYIRNVQQRKTNLPQKLHACPKHHEKPRLGRPDCQTRHAKQDVMHDFEVQAQMQGMALKFSG